MPSSSLRLRRRFRKMFWTICAASLFVATKPVLAQSAPVAQLALGSVVQYRMTLRDRNDPAFRDVIANLDTLESKFAKRFLASRLFAYYDRQSLTAVQRELERIDDYSFDLMSGPSRELLKRIDYLAVFSSSLKGPATIRVVEVETGRVFASEVCDRLTSGEPACIDTVARQLLSSGSEAMAQRRDRLTRQEEAANAAISSVAALQEVTPQYELTVGRASAETGFWDTLRKQSRTRALRPEIETLLGSVKSGMSRCGDLYRDSQPLSLKTCLSGVNKLLDQLNDYK